MSITDARQFVDVAPVIPAVGGVLAVADIIPASGHALLGAEYQTDACATGGDFAEMCQVDLTIGACVPAAPDPTTVLKLLDEQPDLVQGSPFTVYAGVECQASMDENQARAERRLGYVESRWVDMHVAALLADAATAFTAATLVDLVAEGDDILAFLYGGYGTMLMSKGNTVRAFAADAIARDGGGGLTTVNGTRVANISSLYPAGATPDEDLYVTGRIVLIQGSVITRVVPAMVLPDGTCAPQRAIAERMYVPMFECLAYAGTVTP